MAFSGSGSVFSETLQTITNTKLEELSKQRTLYEQQYAALLAAATDEQGSLRRLILLVDGAKACLGVNTSKRKEDGRLGRVISGGTSNPRLETDLKNVDRFLEQAQYDPSVSPKVLEDWEKCILRYLSVQSSKYEYADLYGKLVTEWLSSEKPVPSQDEDVDMEAFEELPNAKKLESRTNWEKLVFEPAAIDVKALEDYLQLLFITGKKDVATKIKSVRDQVEQFETRLAESKPFNTSTLRGVIQGLQSSDLLVNEKREVLKDFLGNNVILAEIADVLNMRMASLQRWSWGEHVPLEQRRHLNGSYSIHMHEDLLQAIFLHYIGIKWSVFWKKALVAFYKEARKPNGLEVPESELQRRIWYLGNRGAFRDRTVVGKRSYTHLSRYLTYQLLDHDYQRIEVQEGEEEVDPESMGLDTTLVPDDLDHGRQLGRQASGGRTKQTAARSTGKQTRVVQSAHQYARMQQQQQQYAVQAPMGQMAVQSDMRSVPARQHWGQQGQQVQLQKYDEDDGYEDSDDFDPSAQSSKRPMQAKQTLLHIISTEVIINTQLHGGLTCFRSVFESWNPLLPHDTILTVLKFFGVSEKWTTFFRTFLQAPLKFMEDGPAAPRLRRRGTPGSHALSDVFGELTLFCLDFSVNQNTGGGMLHRLYDDFWFWSHDYNKCVKAWSCVEQFTKVMSVQLNPSKTGSICISKDGTPDDFKDVLPQGTIRWGFLYLDPSSGRFEIDTKMVDAHVEELRKQLQSKSKSVIDWIQAWNSYAAAFFSSNFGKPANCFGREHVNKMLATHRAIQEKIFEGGNVVHFLKKSIEERFGVQNVPDGFLFFPIELGGLDLKSPFIGLLQIRESVRENPYELMDKFKESEEDAYAEAKRAFDRGEVTRINPQDYPSHKRPRGDHGARDGSPSDYAFFSFDEFVKYREELNGIGNANLLGVYRELLKRPKEENIDVSIQVMQALDQLRGQSNLNGITYDWGDMDSYWKWVAQMYGPEMLDKFGGFNVVDPGLLPVGMVRVFREKRIKWSG